MSAAPANTRCGFIGLAGAPNAGKSTLMNRLVGQKISIVSPAPQTTRHRVGGILTEGPAQAILVDIPGILATEDRFNSALVECARAALAGCDRVLHLRYAPLAGSEDERRVAGLLAELKKPVWQVWTKADLKNAFPKNSGAAADLEYEATYLVSAKTGEGIARLKADILAALPEGPWHYPEDDLSDRDLRFLAAELVREQVFMRLRQEIPYGIATYVETWDESPGERTYIRMVIQTEREAHKRIILGEGGKMLKAIGTSARKEIENLIGGPAFLELWVRVKAKWRKDGRELERLGIASKD